MTSHKQIGVFLYDVNMLLLSRLFTKTSKESAADAGSINADLLTRAGFIHKTMAGVYSFLPLGLKVLRKIETIIREEMDALGAHELLLSALSPKEVWEQTGRWEGFDALFKVPAHSSSSQATKNEYGLNPTHEEVVTPLVKHFVQSHKDLPFGCYQIQTKFRNEPRAKSGLLRGREFGMKDLYSFHTDQTSLDQYYERVAEAYRQIFKRLELADAMYYTTATGGTFSPFSHEFQVLLPQGEDTIYVNEEAEKKGNRIAVNKEIYKGEKGFREEHAAEAANIFKLGTRFSDPFKLQFANQKGELHPILMGCYGMGTTRLLGICAEFFADTSGLIWPASIAPFQYHIIPIARSPEDDTFQKALAIAKKKKDCIVDDRLDLSVGQRLADADLMGLPTRIVISPKTLEKNSMEVKDRRTVTLTMQPL
ncbi:prolyl-tRNA synthetase [Candidatus Peregrinibacteria bacterium]|nr:prolyl-tRNA synthetase [Candidatus Peregrinibacteria bacterium]